MKKMLGNAVWCLLACCMMAAHTWAADLDPRQVGTWPPFPRANATGVVLYEKFALFAAGEEGLLVFDIANPSQPRFVSQLKVGGFASGIALSGSFALIVNDIGVAVVDISTPTRPVLARQLFTEKRSSRIVVDGKRACLATDESGVVIVQIDHVADAEIASIIRTEGEVSNFSISGNHLYLNVQGTAGQMPSQSLWELYDLSNPKGPALFATWTGIPGGHLTIRNSTGYLLAGTEMQILDLSDPAHPKKSATLDIPWYVNGPLIFSGTTGYVRGGVGVSVWDFSDPLAPQQTGHHDTWLYGEGSPSLVVSDFAVHDGIGVIASETITAFGGIAGTSTFEIVDFANAARPELRVRYNLGAYLNRMEVRGDRAYLAKGIAGFQILDLSDPKNPVRLLDYWPSNWVQNVVSFGSTMLVQYPHSFELYEISAISKPQLLGSYEIRNDSGVMGLIAVWQNRAFVMVGDGNALEIVDLSDLRAPRWLREYQVNGWKYRCPTADNFVYKPDEKENWLVYDAVNPDNPILLGGYRSIARALGTEGKDLDFSDPRDPVLIPNRPFCCEERFAYGEGTAALQWGQDWDYLFLVNYAKGDSPTLLGYIDLGDQIVDVRMHKGFALVATRMKGVQVFDVSGVAGIQHRATWRPPIGGVVSDVALRGNLAFAVSRAEGLEVIDLADFRNPQLIASQELKGSFDRLCLSDNKAYMTEYTERGTATALHIIDISDPAQPTGISRLEMPNACISDLLATKQFLYIANCDAGLTLVDVSIPTQPGMARLNAPGTIYSLAACSNYVLVATHAGLLVVDGKQPQEFRVVGAYKTPIYRVAASGTQAYAITETDPPYLHVLDVSQPEPKLLGTIELPATVVYAISTFGNYVAVAGGAGTRIIDCSDPTRPREIARRLANLVSGIAFEGGRLAVAASPEGLILAETLPFFRQIERTHTGGIEVAFETWGKARLQSKARLDNTPWQDVPDVVTNSISFPRSSIHQFFRLRNP